MRTGGLELRAVLATAVVAVALGLGGDAAGVACAADASSSSTTRPAGDQAATIGRWVRDLADRDPNVRDRARVRLMGLDRAGLETLRRVVAESRPLGPSQAAALQEVVNHVYLSSEKDEAAEGEGGFLGVQLSPSGVEVSEAPPPPPGGARPDGGGQPPPVGVAVAGRLPGFCAYPLLEDGDVIVSVTTDDHKTVEFHSTAEMIAAVGQRHAGDRITLGVLRRGKLIQVPVTLDARPAWVGRLVPAADAMGPRERRAAEYWDQAFAPLLKESGTS